MLIRPFKLKPTNIYEIDSIKEIQRIIIIYDSNVKINDDPNKMEIFITNLSYTIGNNYYLPKNDRIHTVNSYTGVINNTFLPDKSLNKLAPIKILEVFNANRYVSETFDEEPIRIINKIPKNSYKIYNMLERFDNFLSIESSIPLYYNMEQQLLLAPDNINEITNIIDNNIIDYKLADFIDDFTHIAIVKIEHDFTNMKFNEIYPTDFDTLEDKIVMIFSSIYRLTLEYMISQVIVLIDFDEGTFNIKHVKTKFPKSLGNDSDGKKEFLNFVMSLDELISFYGEELYFYNNEGEAKFPKLLFNMYVFISETDCRVSVIHKDIFNNKSNILKQSTKGELENDILLDVIY